MLAWKYSVSHQYLATISYISSIINDINMMAGKPLQSNEADGLFNDDQENGRRITCIKKREKKVWIFLYVCVCAHVFKETRHNDNDVYSAKALFSLVIVYLERLAFVETKTQVKLISFVIFVYVVFLPLPPLLLIKGGSKKKRHSCATLCERSPT